MADDVVPNIKISGDVQGLVKAFREGTLSSDQFAKHLEGVVGQSLSRSERGMIAYEKSVAKLASELKGNGATAQLGMMAAAVDKLGGVSKLTAVQTENLAAKVKALVAAGGTAPPGLAALTKGVSGVDTALKGEGLAQAQALAGRLGPLGSILGAIGPAGLAAAAGVAAVALAGGALAGTIGAATAEAVQYAGKISDLSARNDIGVESIQELSFAMARSGGSVEDLTRSIDKLDKVIVSTPDKLTAIGLSAQALSKMDADKKLEAVVKAIEAIENPALRNATALELLGKKADEARIAFGSLSEQSSRARDLGRVMDEATVGQLDALGDAADEFGLTWEGMWRNIGAAVAGSPEIEDAIVGITDRLGSLSKWVQDNGGTVSDSVGDIVVALGKLKTAAGDFVDNPLVSFLVKINPLTIAAKVGMYELGAAMDFLAGASGRLDKELNEKNLAAFTPTRLPAGVKKGGAADLPMSPEELERLAKEAEKAEKAFKKLASDGLKAYYDELAKDRATREAVVSLDKLGLSAEDATFEMNMLALKVENAGGVASLTDDQLKKLVAEMLKLRGAGGEGAIGIETLTDAVDEAGDRMVDVLGEETPEAAEKAAKAAQAALQKIQQGVEGVDDRTKRVVSRAAELGKVFGNLDDESLRDLAEGLMNIEELSDAWIGILDGVFDLADAFGLADTAAGKFVGNLRAGAKAGQELLGAIMKGDLGGILSAAAKGAKGIIDAINGSGSRGEAAVQGASAAAGVFGPMGASFAAVGGLIFGGGGPEHIGDEDLGKEFGKLTEAQEALNAATERYGFTVAELGPIFKQQELDTMVGQLLADQRLLTGSGIENETVIRRMAPAYQEYFNTVQASGAAIPEAMRPALQSMVDMGLLTDAAGNKLDSLEGVNFTADLAQGIQDLVDKMDEFLDRLGGIPPSIDTTITTHLVEVKESRGGGSGEVTVPVDTESIPGFSKGSGGVQDFGAGTVAVLHGREAVVRETDLQRLLSFAMNGGGGGGVAGPGSPTPIFNFDVYVAGQKLDDVFIRRRDAGYI